MCKRQSAFDKHSRTILVCVYRTSTKYHNPSLEIRRIFGYSFFDFIPYIADVRGGPGGQQRPDRLPVRHAAEHPGAGAQRDAGAVRERLPPAAGHRHTAEHHRRAEPDRPAPIFRMSWDAA